MSLFFVLSVEMTFHFLLYTPGLSKTSLTT